MARNDDTPRNHSARPGRSRPPGGKPHGGKPHGGKPHGGKLHGGNPPGGKPWRRPAASKGSSEHEGERIAKVIARAGLTSRRDAEDWIAAGRVSVNGAVITSPALNIGPRDRVTVDGAPLPERERTRLFLYHKPAGLVTTNLDPEGRPTIFDRLPKNLPRLLTVGRLDIGTEGLLLLTNDGGLARVLELPETGWLRRYRVRALGHVTQPDLDALRDGVTVEGIHYGPIEATLDRDQGSNVWITFAIREGKNREVRNVLGHLGLAVNRLIRVSYGPFQLGELAEGAVEEVRTRVLRDQLGERVIEEANCDFTAPIQQRPDTATLAPPPDRDGRRERGPRRGDDERPRFGDKRIRRDHRGDMTPDDVQGRPRRGHAWRSEDAPLRRHYRGERKPEHQPDLAAAEKRAGLLKDRKGRNVLVERIGTPKAEAPARRPPPKSARGQRPFRSRDEGSDRLSGERDFKPRSGRPGKPRGERPFRHEDGPRKPAGERFGTRGDRSGKPHGDRPFKPRGERFDKPQGERPFKPRGERFDKPRGECPFRRDERPGKPRGERSGKPQGERPFKPRGERFDKPRGERSGGPRGGKSFKGRPRKHDRGSGPRPSRPR